MIQDPWMRACGCCGPEDTEEFGDGEISWVLSELTHKELWLTCGNYVSNYKCVIPVSPVCSQEQRLTSNTWLWLEIQEACGEGNRSPLQCSCLENPRDRGAWWAAVCGVAQSRTQLKRLSSSSSSKRLENGLNNLNWTMRTFSLERLSQQEWYPHGNAFLIEYGVFAF